MHDLAATDGTFHDVSIDLTGLTPGAEYCAEIVATNVTGHSPIDDGDQAFWYQPAQLPKLTVSLSGSGTGVVTSSPAGIDCGDGASQCSASFAPGTQVTLTATPSTGSTFGLWLSAPGCSTPNVNTCKVTVNNDTSIGALFGGQPTHTLTVVNGDAALGGVTSSPSGIDCGSTCSYAFNFGTQVTLTATPGSGSSFAGWSGGGCSGTGTCQVTLNADTTVTANFGSGPVPPPGVFCRVPKVKGKKLAAAEKAVRTAHCSLGKIMRVKSSKKNRGHVISVKPKPGTRLKKGAKVALKVGK